MKICPCCGFESANSANGVLSEACLSCGAYSVGEPLPRPEHELPSYARSLVLTVMGTLMVLLFLTQTIIDVADRSTRGAISNLAAFSMIPSDLWSWIAAGETAAWRLKWAMIPLTLLVVFVGRKLYGSIRQSPTRFCGVRYARNGYAASLAVPLLVLILIGITVPARLRDRQLGIEAGFKAMGYASDRALLQYREQFGVLPSEWKDLVRLPDQDGSIAALLRDIDAAGYKVIGADIAALPTEKPRTLRGEVLRNASINIAADDTLSTGLPFPSYELRLPGWDKLLGTEDDLIVLDGVTYTTSELPRRGVSAASAGQKRQP